MKLFEDHYLKAIEAAVQASGEIMRIYQTSFLKNFKSDGSPVTEADTASSRIIEDILESTGIPIICEENPNFDYHIRKSWKEVWVIDPLDGTKEYIRRNGEFAVNIALVRDGEAVFGLIASPVNRRLLFGGLGKGAFVANFDTATDEKHWVKLEPQPINSPIVLASSRTPYRGQEVELINHIQQFDEIDYLKKGSALKFFDLAEGTADVYPRFAPTMEWDIAAGQAILNELGGVVVDAYSGEPLTYNKESLYNPHFVAKSKAYLTKLEQ